MKDFDETKHGSTIKPKRTKVTQYVEALVKKDAIFFFVVDIMMRGEGLLIDWLPSLFNTVLVFDCFV
jgi:hypothetical protein